MKQTKIIMGMPITIEIVDVNAKKQDIKSIFDYFKQVDERYSTYKPTSEISQINKGLPRSRWSTEIKKVMDMCEQTKQETGGFFDIEHNGQLDPSGLVKGWAIANAAKKLAAKGYKNFYVDAGGDMQVSGHNANNKLWQIGLRNPFNRSEVIKTLAVTNKGVATSGTYIRGQHIYNPLSKHKTVEEIVAVTVVGPNIYNADRFATAAFAMGKPGINFIEVLKDYDAYMIEPNGIATMTTGFEGYVAA